MARFFHPNPLQFPHFYSSILLKILSTRFACILKNKIVFPQFFNPSSISAFKFLTNVSTDNYHKYESTKFRKKWKFPGHPLSRNLSIAWFFCFEIKKALKRKEEKNRGRRGYSASPHLLLAPWKRLCSNDKRCLSIYEARWNPELSRAREILPLSLSLSVRG